MRTAEIIENVILAFLILMAFNLAYKLGEVRGIDFVMGKMFVQKRNVITMPEPANDKELLHAE